MNKQLTKHSTATIYICGTIIIAHALAMYLYISELFIESLGHLSTSVHGRDGDVL